MIPKASQRAGGQHLATHLLNAHDNERVEVLDVRGAVANDLHGAFAEWHATSKGTQCQKYLYSMSLNPDHRQGQLKPEQYQDFINRAETKLGLTGQPRAVVVHVKHGREHYHVVWSRIHPDTLKAIQLSHDRPKLISVAQDFAREHGIRLPPGMQPEAAKEPEKDKKATNLAEQQQEERTGEKKEDRIASVSAAWRETKTGAAFIRALQGRGYTAARGDRRAVVILDRFGEIHSLARQIEGANTKDLKARLVDVDIDRLPSVADVQAAAEKAKAAVRPTIDYWKAAQQRREALREQQAKRRADLDEKRARLDRRQRLEVATVRARLLVEKVQVQDGRDARKPGPIVAAFSRVTGIDAIVGLYRQRQDARRETLQTIRLDALQRRQRRERIDFGRHYRALGRVEKRETRSLETSLRRELWRELARTPGLSQAEKLDRVAALREEYRNAKSGPTSPTAGRFNQAAEPRPPKTLDEAKAERALEELQKMRDRSRDRSRDHEPGR